MGKDKFKLSQSIKEISHNEAVKQQKKQGHINLEKIATAFYFVGLAIFIAALFFEEKTTSFILHAAVLVFSGYYIIIEGVVDTIKSTIKKKIFWPNVHVLMTLAAIGGFIIGDYREGALLILIFAGAHFLEQYTESKSKKEITNLLKLNPTKARLLKDDGSVEIVDVANLQIGDILQVLNGDQIPTDGTIIAGSSLINESSITGESMPVEKEEGDYVYGSTINGNGVFIMRVTKSSEDTVIAKIIKMVSQAQTNISKTASFIKRFEPKYVTTVLLIAPLFYLAGVYLFSWSSALSFYKTMILLIVASPCALAATDIPATLSGISNLAKRGVLFKGGSHLSNLSDIKAVAFDKTGTLTQGKPILTDFYLDPSISEKEKRIYENIIFSMEKQSNHPIAEAVIAYFENAKLLDLKAENIIGVGLQASYKDNIYRLVKPMEESSLSEVMKHKTIELEKAAKTVIYFMCNQKALGFIAVQDTPKESSKDAVNYFKQQNIHTVMLTGDAIITGQAIGEQLGIDQVVANILPQDKAQIIIDLKQKYGAVAMIGDGVNDAPALAAADIGVAMGSGTDIAIEAADAVLMQNDLSKFTYTHKVAKKLRRVVWQNIFFSMGVVAALLITNVFQAINMTVAVVMHEGSTLMVIFNGLRLLRKVK